MYLTMIQTSKSDNDVDDVLIKVQIKHIYNIFYDTADANAAITTTTTSITITTTNHALFQQKRYDIEHL